tara:strand:- start:234 stop:587 length:354 start_codon:yes stop_codon:yes gene_type:complete
MDGKPLVTMEESIAAPANKRFRSLIQELFSLVEELYAENDQLSTEVAAQEDVSAQLEKYRQENLRLKEALFWLGSSELEAETTLKLQSKIRKFVAETLKVNKSQEDLSSDSEYSEGE